MQVVRRAVEGSVYAHNDDGEDGGDRDDTASLFGDKSHVVDLKNLPTALALSLSEFDFDGDGIVSLHELNKAARILKRHRSKLRWFIFCSLVLAICFVLLGGMFGLVYAVVQISKETTIGTSGGAAVMMTKNGDNVVATGMATSSFAHSEIDQNQWAKMESISLVSRGMQVQVPVKTIVRMPLASLGGMARDLTQGPLLISTDHGSVLMVGSTLNVDDDLKAYISQMTASATNMLVSLIGFAPVINEPLGAEEGEEAVHANASSHHHRRRWLAEGSGECSGSDEVCPFAAVNVIAHQMISPDSSSKKEETRRHHRHANKR